MLTVAFGSVLKAEGEGELGFVFKELICKRVPPGHKDHLHVDHVDDDGEVIMIIMLIMIMLAMNLSDKMMGNSMIVLNLCSLITDQAL